MSQQWPGTQVGGRAAPSIPAPQAPAPPPFIPGVVTPRQQASEVRANNAEIRAQQDQAIQMERLRLEQEKAAKDRGAGSLDPKTQEGQKNIARGILVNSGVNLETGEDPVAELIKGSTSGTVQRFGADIYGGVTGEATSGMENIGRLRAIGNDMVLQMTGGSLGANISNTDREFIAARMGDIANPDKPWNERLAAWNEVKSRMASISGIQLPATGATGTAQASAGAPPPGGGGGNLPIDLKPLPDANSAEKPVVGDMSGMQTVATGQTRNAPTPEDQQTTAQINQMWLNGASMAEINGYLTARGYPASPPPSAEQARYYRKHGGPFQINRFVPLSVRSRAAAGPVGSYAAGAADGMTFGFSDELYGAANAAAGGDYTQARDEFQGRKTAMAEMNPVPNFLGNISGALMAGPVARAAGLQFAPDATRAAGAAMTANPVATSAGMGALYGAGMDNQNRLRGAALGGALGAGLGAGVKYGVTPAANALTDRLAQRRTNGVIPNAAEVAAAGQAEGVTVNRAMIDPRVENKVTGVDASLVGGPKLQARMRDIEGQIEGRVNALGRGGNAMEKATAGQALQSAGERFIKDSGKAAARKYDRAERLAGDAKVAPQQSLQEVDDAIARLSETPGTNAAEISFLNTLKGDLSNDLSVGALRRMRTSLRKKINNGGLVFGEDEARVLGIMDAAATDIRNGLQAQGKGKAAKAFDLADKEYRGRMEFINGTLQKVIGKRGSNLSAETVAKNLNGMLRGRDSEGARAFLSKLTPEEHADFGATLANSLGRSSPDEPFSVATFLRHTKEDAFPPAALKVAFGEEGAQSIQNLRVLGKEVKRVTSAMNSRKSSSGVAIDYKSWLTNALLGLGGGAGTGSWAGAVVGTVAPTAIRAGRDAITARMLLNPKITKWIRTAPPTTNPAAINAHIGRLESMSRAGAIGRMDAQAIQDYLRAAAGQSPSRAAAQDEGN